MRTDKYHLDNKIKSKTIRWQKLQPQTERKNFYKYDLDKTHQNHTQFSYG